MKYCINCGTELPDNAKFCFSCGASQDVDDNSETKREQTFAGKIYKCPNCGAVVDSFESRCPECGYEFRGAESTKSLKEFSLKLTKAHSDSEKEDLIKSFPIPNAKEDIIDFMLLATSNIQTEENESLYKSWIIKLEQGYQKAQILMKDDEDFLIVEDLYNKTKKKIGGKKVLRTAGKAITKTGSTIGFLINFIVENALTIIGIIICAIAVNVNNHHGNSSMIELAGTAMLYVSAGSLAKRNSSLIGYAICALSAGYLFYASNDLRNGSMFELGGFIVIILIGVSVFKKGITDKKNKGE